MKDLVIFGTKEMAEVAHFFFTHDSQYKVKAFTVDGQHADQSLFMGLPVIPFEEVHEHFPATSSEMFVAIGYGKINENRKNKYLEAKEKGYKLATYICSKAFYWGTNAIGDNTMILEGVVIQPFVGIGNNVVIWSANHIGHHTQIKDHSFLTSHVVIGGGAEIGEQCFLGINATVRDHIKIGARCVIGAGAIIMADAEPDGLYVAQPTARAAVSSSRVKL
jgi:sugar O-acyltransferase (sialic acid O-acetyltransferase NeuD family)